jgi:hypothetical protein
MGILKYLIVSVSGLVFAGLVLVAGPAASAAMTTRACADVTVASHEARPSNAKGCYWKCDRWNKRGYCAHSRRVCPYSGGRYNNTTSSSGNSSYNNSSSSSGSYNNGSGGGRYNNTTSSSGNSSYNNTTSSSGSYNNW